MMPMAGLRFCGSLLLVSAACAAEAADPRLTAIIERMAGNLARVPNYTCTQTVERFKRGEACRECEYKDRLRLEVAFVGSHEQFAWPGESEFGDRNIFELIGTGMIMTGDFASFANRVFVMDRPEFTYAGETVLDGRQTHRYNYRVGADRSTFGAQIGAEEGYSAYSGSFWADAENLDVRRLDIEANDFPARLDVGRVKATVSYSRIPIGKSEFLLPRSTEAEILSRKSVLSRNRTEYKTCRQYVGESTIRFGDESAPTSAGRIPESAAPAAPLPAGLQFRTYLASTLRFSECAIGDPVTFVVDREVRRGAVRVPKGAILHCRIVTLAEHLRPIQTVVLGLSTTALEYNGMRLEFRGGIRQLVGLQTDSFRPGPQSPADHIEVKGNQSILYIDPGHRQIAKGFQFYWNTLPQEKP